MTTITGVFTSFNLTTDLPHLRTDDGHDVLVGVPRGSTEELARACWKNKTHVEITGIAAIHKGKVTAINVETMKVITKDDDGTKT